MKIEDIKDKYTMQDILARYGITVKKGFCKCVFHTGDRTASMKVYDDSFYCFGCGKGGDFIKFVQLYEGLSFREACKFISGEELDRKDKRQVVAVRTQRNARVKRQEALRKKLDEVNKQFTGIWDIYLRSEPFSDEWTEAFNTWQLLCYKQEDLFKQLED